MTTNRCDAEVFKLTSTQHMEITTLVVAPAPPDPAPAPAPAAVAGAAATKSPHCKDRIGFQKLDAMYV